MTTSSGLTMRRELCCVEYFVIWIPQEIWNNLQELNEVLEAHGPAEVSILNVGANPKLIHGTDPNAC